MIATSVHDTFFDKIKIIIGISGCNTPDVVNEARLFEPYCHYMMLSAPYYNNPSQEGLYLHFSAVIAEINREFILYNIPSRCGVNIEPDTVKRLCTKFSRIVGIKEASGSVNQVMDIKKQCNNIYILSGDDALTLPFMAVGAVGVVSVVSNVVPKQMIDMYNKYVNGSYDDATSVFYKLYPLMKLCFIEPNPVPIKYILHKQDALFLDCVRMPLAPLSEKSKEVIDIYFSNLPFGF